MIELNVPYANKVIAEQLFKVKPNTFNSKKSTYLEYLKQFYDYEIVNKKIILRKELKPFKTRMQTRESRTEEYVEVYKNLTHKAIERKPLNSGSNIAREIDQSVFKPFENHKESTIGGYIRDILKEGYEVIDRQWCSVDYSTNTYEPLTNEQKGFLVELFNTNSSYLNILEMQLVADFECGNIDKEEFDKKAGSMLQVKYNKVMKIFKAKYGFRPFKVPNWREKKPIMDFKEKVG